MKKVILFLLIGGISLAAFFAWYSSLRFKQTPRTDISIDSAESSAVISVLKEDVLELAGNIGARSTTHYQNLLAASKYLQTRFAEIGYEPSLQTYQAKGHEVSNIYAIKPSSTGDGEVLVIGAHYDSQYSNPGADDNASGVAVLLALMKSLKSASLKRNIHFVCFVNEELPHSHSPDMGAWRYAKFVSELKVPVLGMISLESVGYFDSAKGSQRYPFKFLELMYPDSGDFIAVVGNLKSHTLVSSITEAFHTSSPLKTEGAVLPQFIRDIGRSDHAPFWQRGFQAVMVTDTANFRNANYHQPTDHPNTLDYEKMYQVYLGLNQFLSTL
jgi:Zn-dependent M28 family amino/carboxypeptidase